MTILGTLAKRTEHAVDTFVRVLDAVADNPALNLEDFLFGPVSLVASQHPRSRLRRRVRLGMVSR
ncbi:MAG: hypothetical protein R6X19_11240 [Kiritimatiellia bacterium]